MRVGIGIRPIILVTPEIQEFLGTIFVELNDLKDIEVHSDNLDYLSVFLLEQAKKLNLKFSIHCIHMYVKPPINFCSADKMDIINTEDDLKKSIKYAKKLKAKYIIIHPDVPKKCSKKDALDILETHIKNNLKLLNKNQWILVENMPGKEYALSTPEEFQDFLKRFKRTDRVAVCWDIGHEIERFKKQDFVFPKKLGKKIKEVHISGVDKNFHDHHPLTQGILKLKKAIDSLKKINYKGVIVFEIITKNPLDIIESKNLIDKYI